MRSLSEHRRRERGFALLLVLAMAAAVALLLYKELPRAVFESQRTKEDMLVERGEEYKMGIRRYYHKFRRLPNTIEELENTNGQRFLRRRYKDPFTGKDEWKIIKADAAGNLIDSVQSKKSVTDKDGEKKGGTGSVSLGSSLGDAANQAGAGEGSNIALQRRSSDRGVGADLAMQQYQQRDSADPNNPPGTMIMPPGGQPQGGQSGPPPVPQPPQFGSMPGGQPVMGPEQVGQGGSAIPGQPQFGQPGFSPGVTPIPGQQFPPGTLPPGLRLPGMVPQPGGMPPQPGAYPGAGQQQQGGSPMTQPGLGGGGSPMTQQGLGGAPQTGPVQGPPGSGRQGFNPLQGVQGPGQPAIGTPGMQVPPTAIQGILGNLTNPRAGAGVGQPGLFGAGGIAGFASKHKGEGIKLIEERSKINEWEFIYDPRKDKRVVGGAAMGGGLPGGNPGGALTGSGSGSGSSGGMSGGSGSSSSGTGRTGGRF